MEVSCLKERMGLEGMGGQGCTEKMSCTGKYFHISR